MRPALCIVVPVLNEAETLAPSLDELQRFRQRGARVVVVDGGSEDDTLAIARTHADLALLAPRGRAAQMNAGAALCPADVLLLIENRVRDGKAGWEYALARTNPFVLKAWCDDMQVWSQERIQASDPDQPYFNITVGPFPRKEN